MKSTHLLLSTLICVSQTFAADASPPELAAARARHDTAIAAATKPLRDRYLLELQQLKGRAMSMKNLDLAVAIDQEIKALSTPGSTHVASKSSLGALLPGTKWVPEGFGEEIQFSSATMLTFTNEQGNKRTYSFKVERDGDTVTYVYMSTGDKVGSMKFSNDQSSFVHDKKKYIRAAN